MVVKVKFSFILNGKIVSAESDMYSTLLDMLRDYFGLTGAKRGCEIGECGACTVLFNGKAVCSCIILAPSVENCEVLTIEGLTNKELRLFQEAFITAGAVQCGYCTPGMILSAKSLLDCKLDLSIKDIKVAISGNLCRCTGYEQIVEAIHNVANYLKEKEVL